MVGDFTQSNGAGHQTDRYTDSRTKTERKQGNNSSHLSRHTTLPGSQRHSIRATAIWEKTKWETSVNLSSESRTCFLGASLGTQLPG